MNRSKPFPMAEISQPTPFTALTLLIAVLLLPAHCITLNEKEATNSSNWVATQQLGLAQWPKHVYARSQNSSATST